MVDKEAYKALVERVSYSWGEVNKPQMKWYDKCKQINLWTYWQGIGVDKVDILIVGQDWGKPFWPGTVGKKKHQQIDSNIDSINAGDLNTLYLSPGITSPWATDRNLAKFIKEIKVGDKSLYEDVNAARYDNLFFTNFCLGYRVVKETGDMTQEIMLRDADNFRELINCLNPKIIICIGKDTYECVLKTLFNIQLQLNACDYMGLLNEGKNRIVGEYGKKSVIVYGMGHCGSMGVNINRKKFEEKAYPNKAGKNGLTLMKEDWARISNDVVALGIKSEKLAF